MLLDDVARPGEQHARHAVVRADRAAVVNRPVAPLLDASKIGLAARSQAELARDDFLGEVTFGDE